LNKELIVLMIVTISAIPFVAYSDIAGVYVGDIKAGSSPFDLYNSTIASSGTLATLDTDLSYTGQSDEVDWIKVVASPTNNSRAILGFWDILTDDVNVMIWQNGTSSGGWYNEFQVEGSNTQALQNPTFDIEFEETSGTAMIVYYESTGDILKYRTLDNDSTTWSSESSITGSDGARMVRLAPNPNNDEIFLIYETVDNDVESTLWSGSAWSSVTVHETDSIMSTGLKNTVVMDIAWEYSTEEALAVWYDSTGSLRYNTFTSDSWDTEGNVDAQFDAATGKGAQVTLSHQQYNTDNIGLVAVGGNDKDLWSMIWNGASWEDFIQESAGGFEAGKGYNANFIQDPLSDDLYLLWLEKTDLGMKMKIWDNGTSSWGSTQELISTGQKQPVIVDVRPDGTMGVMGGDKNTPYGYYLQCDGGDDCSNIANWIDEGDFSGGGAQLLDKGQGYDFAFLREGDSGHDPISASDVFSFVETTNVVGSYNITSSDVFAFVETSDVVKTHAPKSVSDVFSFVESDSVIAHYVASGTDVFPFVESHEASQQETREESDVFTFVENQTVQVSYIRNGTDTFAFVEMVDLTGMFERDGIDSFDFVEQVNSAKGYETNATDIFGFVETHDTNQSQARNAVDTFNFFEAEFWNTIKHSVVNGTDVMGFNETANVLSPRTGQDIWSFVEIIDVVPPFEPGGQFIWFKINVPTADRLGGIFAASCPGGYYVSGISINGTLICTALP
jgi:hypothetical protein